MVWFYSSGGAWLCVDALFGGDFYSCLLGRSQAGFILVPWEMSRWFGFGDSGGAWLCVDALFGGDFYSCLLGRSQAGFILVPREMYGLIGVTREAYGLIRSLGRCKV